MPPVDDTTVADLYELYRGDLRGFLKALDDGIPPLIGAPTPVGFDLLRPVLRQRYDVELGQLAEGKRVEQLRRWGETEPAVPQTQQSLQKLWSVKAQSTVSDAVAYLIKQGYAVTLPRRDGREPIQYALSGVSRIIFG